MTDGDQPDVAFNPYAAPGVLDTVASTETTAESVRRQYLSHEHSIKSIGTLYLLGAVLLVPMGVVMGVVSVYAALGGQTFDVTAALVGVVYVVLGGLQGATALGLRKFKPWSRIAGIIFSVIGLIGIPIGTIISAYLLYLLISKKGVYVFSEEYQQIISSTPHIKYKTSIIVWIFLAILIGVISLAIAAALFG